MPLLFLDTNVLIDLAGPKRTADYFRKLNDSTPLNRIATSLLCVAEFLTGADGHEEAWLKQWMKTGELEVHFLDTIKVAELAAKLKKRDKLKMPDALALASALLADAVFLTGDIALIKVAQRHGKAGNPF